MLLPSEIELFKYLHGGYPVMDRLRMLQERLGNLKYLEATEKASKNPSVRYLEDISFSITQVEAEINQLTFARANPLTMVNGAVQ